MNKRNPIARHVSFMQRYQYRWVLIIALCWTTINFVYWAYFPHAPADPRSQGFIFTPETAALRITVVFVMSSIMGYMLMFRLRQLFRNLPLLVNILLKTSVLMFTSLLMNFLLHVTYTCIILHYSFGTSLYNFFTASSSVAWLLQHSTGWVVIFFFTQVFIESYEKYSPGVFWDIMIGRYIKPKVERRIVMFLDLKDSTHIAETLQSKVYFSFIRDFIYYVSIALLEYDGRIYQYVGDEIVTSWLSSPRNAEKCIKAILLSERLIKRNSRYFLRKYGFVPEFKVGIHTGEVTVGEVGIIKKDIAISGDTMNTAARIRTSCNELSAKYIASKDFIDGLIMPHNIESLGATELRGKSDMIELFALRM